MRIIDIFEQVPSNSHFFTKLRINIGNFTFTTSQKTNKLGTLKNLYFVTHVQKFHLRIIGSRRGKVIRLMLLTNHNLVLSFYIHL